MKCLSCDFWIHNNDQCNNYDNYCPNCYQTKMSNDKTSNDEDVINTEDVNINHQSYSTVCDNISEFNYHIDSDNSEQRSITQTVLSLQCNSAYQMFNNNTSTVISYLPDVIICVKNTTSFTAITDIPEELIPISRPESELMDDTSNGIYSTTFKETMMDFVSHSIAKLDLIPENFLKLETYLKEEFFREQVNINIDYSDEYNSHGKFIENLFKDDVSMRKIENIIEKKFPLKTQDVMSEDMTQDVLTLFVPQNEYSLPYIITGGTCVVNEKKILL